LETWAAKRILHLLEKTVVAASSRNTRAEEREGERRREGEREGERERRFSSDDDDDDDSNFLSSASFFFLLSLFDSFSFSV
jgi:hypothetical protein